MAQKMPIMMLAIITFTFLLPSHLSGQEAKQPAAGSGIKQDNPRSEDILNEALKKEADALKRLDAQKKASDASDAVEWQQAKKKDPSTFRKLVFAAQMRLARFGYSTGSFDGMLDDKTMKALKEYQRHNGLPPTGDLDIKTFDKLAEDEKAINRFIPTLPFFLSMTTAISSGRWVSG